MSSDDYPLLAFAIPFAGIVGIFVGSFLNVVVYRTPLGLSVSAPRSFCPTCRHQLGWWENIPIASWLALKGRCRNCHQRISARYPVVELSTGIVFALITWAWHGGGLSVAYCFLAASMIAVSLIEYGGKRSPLSVAAIGAFGGQLILVIVAGWQHLWTVVGGSLGGFAVAAITLAILRSTDPECVDPRGHGRTALLVAGCWVGGLGAGPAAFGATAWIITYALCMLGSWSTARRLLGAGSSQTATPPIHPVLGTPLVTALAVAMAASLVVRG